MSSTSDWSYFLDRGTPKPLDPFEKELKRFLNFGKELWGFERKNLVAEEEIVEPIDALASNALDLIRNRFYASKDKPVQIKNIEFLIGNHDFLDLIAEKKIRFCSDTSPGLIDAVSDGIIYLSNKKALGRGGNPVAYKNSKGAARKFILKFGPFLDELEKQGFKTYQSKVNELNNNGIKSPRGKNWHITSIKRAIELWNKVKLENTNQKNTISKTPKLEL